MGDRGVDQLKHIVMLLSNAFRPDPRVLKEARSLARAGYKVTVICWDREGEFADREEVDGFEVQRISVRAGYSSGSSQVFHLPRFWVQALKEMCILRPDAIHCHDLDTALAGYWYARRHGISWILDSHECYPEQIGPQVNPAIYLLLLFLEWHMTRRATRVVTVGELLAKRFRSMGATVSVVGNYQYISAVTSKHGISRESLNLGPDDFVVAYIGGFTVGRAILPLIRATEYVPNVKILLLGSGPQRPVVESQLENHPRVHYLGQVPQDQVADYTSVADVIYYGLYDHHRNNRYSSPNALFNALAAGKPVLTTNVGEIARIIREEQCGIVVEHSSPALLGQAIKSLRDPDLRNLLSANARRAAEVKYNWSIAEKALLKVYQEVIAGDQLSAKGPKTNIT